MIENHPNTNDTAPNLPENPDEAAQELLDLFNSRNGWRVDGPSWDEIAKDPELKEAYVKKSEETELRFRWLAEMFRSEMFYMHKEIKTNYGFLHVFHFSYEAADSDNPTPNALLFFTDDTQTVASGTLYRKNESGWVSEKYDDVASRYYDAMM